MSRPIFLIEKSMNLFDQKPMKYLSMSRFLCPIKGLCAQKYCSRGSTFHHLSEMNLIFLESVEIGNSLKANFDRNCVVFYRPQMPM